MRKIDDYLLIKHTHNGRVYPRLDCWGLIVDFYRENLKINLDEHTDLTQKSMTKGVNEECKQGRFIEVITPEDYDIVCFFLRDRLFHVGVFLNGHLLHTSERKNCRFEKLDGAMCACKKRFFRYVKN